MDEISLGKTRIILLPVLLGLIIIFFLKIFSIEFSLLLWIILLIAIFLISLLLLMRSRVISGTFSPISKLPLSSILKTVAWIVVVLVIIFFITLLTPDSRHEICFENGGSLIEDEFGVPWICGTVLFKNIDITTETPDYGFYLLGIPEGESVNVTFTLRDKTQKCEIPFTIDSPPDELSGVRVSLGVADESILDHENLYEGLVYVYVNGVSLLSEDKIPTRYFVTDGQKYNATLRVETGTCQYRIGVRKSNFFFSS